MEEPQTRPLCSKCGARPCLKRYGIKKTANSVYTKACSWCSRSPGKYKARRKKAATDYRVRLKLEAMRAYSPDGVPRCACPKCPEHIRPHIEFLSIDHVNGDGAAHRRSFASATPGRSCATPGRPFAGRASGWMFYRWLKQEGYPPGYAVLCMLCNMFKGTKTDRRCPHEDD